MNDLISVIIPVHNAEEFLEETVLSVLNQTYKNLELILVEDASTDDSFALMEKLSGTDKRIRIFRMGKPSGAARTRNYGLSKAEGDYIAYLDADDLWEKDKLEKELAFLKEKQAAFVFTGYEFADEEGKGTGHVVKVPETLSYKQALGNTTIFTSTVLLNRSRIPEELLQMPVIKSEDTATWWRILKSGITAYGLDENLVRYRRAGKSLSSNKVEALRRIWRLYREVAKLSVPVSAYYFVRWAFRAVARRVS